MRSRPANTLCKLIFLLLACVFQLQATAQQAVSTERVIRPFTCGREFQRTDPYIIQKVFWNAKLSHDQYIAYLRSFDHRIRQAWAQVEDEQTREQNIKGYATAELADCLQESLTSSDQVWRFDEFGECKKKKRYIFRSRFHQCQAGTIIVRQGKIIFKHITDKIYID
jgi:hypothetical protein